VPGFIEDCPLDDQRYDNLEDLTVRTLSALNVDACLAHASPQFRYIGERTAALRRQFCGRAHGSTGTDGMAVIVALGRLVRHADRILQGDLSGMDCISSTQGLWKRMMCEWPMGDYGRTLAEYLNSHGLAKGKILELGAGVGHASKFIHVPADTVYIKTDLNKVILQMYNRGGILERFDIDSDDAPYEDVDLIFASNVLHCARAKDKTLRSLFRMLRRGGYLVFSEGVPEVQPGREWCLTPLFGFLDGWWDRGGFMDLEHWRTLARDAGLSIVASEPIRCGRNLVGNLIACRKETVHL
jgi:SAM-dependent methyltransferase